MWLLTALFLFLWPLAWDKHHRAWTPLFVFTSLPYVFKDVDIVKTLLRLVFLMSVSTSTRDHLTYPTAKKWSLNISDCKTFSGVPWTARRSNQSILKEIKPEYSLEGLMLKLKLHCFSHLIQRADSLEKTLMLGKTEGKRRKGAAEDEMVG